MIKGCVIVYHFFNYCKNSPIFIDIAKGFKTD